VRGCSRRTRMMPHLSKGMEWAVPVSNRRGPDIHRRPTAFRGESDTFITVVGIAGRRNVLRHPPTRIEPMTKGFSILYQLSYLKKERIIQLLFYSTANLSPLLPPLRLIVSSNRFMIGLRIRNQLGSALISPGTRWMYAHQPETGWITGGGTSPDCHAQNASVCRKWPVDTACSSAR